MIHSTDKLRYTIRLDSDSAIRKDPYARERQEGEDCGSCFNPARDYFCGNCAPGLECVKDPRSELLPDLPSSCKRTPG